MGDICSPSSHSLIGWKERMKDKKQFQSHKVENLADKR